MRPDVPAPATAPLVAPFAAHVARQRELRPGLRLHGDDAVDPLDATAEGTCVPGLHIVLLLEGRLDVAYGDRRVELATVPGRGEVGSFMLNVSRPEAFRRSARRGRYARRLSLSVSHEWLAQLQSASAAPWSAALQKLLDGHLTLQRWQPTERAVALSEQLLRPPACAPLLQGLYLESRLIDLLGEALAPLQDDTAAAPAVAATPAMARRMRELREFLHSEATDELSLDEIARRWAMSPSVLQAQFRRAYGTTVFAFLRESRLQRARAALERDGLGVKQAAHLAGYTSAANFATAFSRRFGLTPTQARRAVQR